MLAELATSIYKRLYNAELDGIFLEIETIEDGFEKAIAQYEFPYKDGALLEDMGQKARQIRIRCYFWDDFAFHNTYDAHQALLDHLHSHEYFELVHPQYGPIKGCVQSVSVRHDDSIRAAEVDVTFIETLTDEDSEDGQPYENVESATEESYSDSINAGMDSAESDMEAWA
jgi:prophage DNA circulation protein